MTIEGNMSAIGKRSAMRQEYEIGVNDQGKIQYLNTELWSTAGTSINEATSPAIASQSANCYDTTTWTRESNDVMTDIPSNTQCRAPGTR